MIVNFIVGGRPHRRGLSGAEILGDVCAAVVEDEGHLSGGNWEARLQDGRMLDVSDQVAMQVSHEENVFLSPRAGVSG